MNEKRGQRAMLELISEQTEQPIAKMIREAMLADYEASNMEKASNKNHAYEGRKHDKS